MLDVFLVFFVTLAIFPAVLVKIQLYPPGRNYDFFHSEALFRQVTIFLNFNIFATAGNFTANYIQWVGIDRVDGGSEEIDTRLVVYSHRRST